MSEISVDIQWEQAESNFPEDNYKTDHVIDFNSNHKVRGAAAPSWGGNPDYVNPEQTLAASLSSCHMMTFLALAAKANWPVCHYSDHAVAELGKNAKGLMSVTKLRLNPKVDFSGDFAVDKSELHKMHERSHRYCFVANSISAEMVINAV